MDITLIIVIGGASIALVLLFVGLFVTIRSDRTVEDRLGRYVETGSASEKEARQKSTPVADWLDVRVSQSSYGNRISNDLARADLKLKPGEYIALMVIMFIGLGFIGWFIGGKNILVGLIGAIIGLFLPGMYVGQQKAKRLQRFCDQLPDMLNLMVNGLRAGYSTMQAMEAVSKELPSPICDEFRRVVQEMQLGVPMQVALDNLLRRIPSEDLDLVITAINVQREVGGNLAEILDSISFTIRERIRMKGEIRVLTTQVMYSGRFLAMMPIIVAVLLFFINREYMLEYTKAENNSPIPCGYISLGCSAALIISGYFVMNKLADIEI